MEMSPDSKIHGANMGRTWHGAIMGPIWGRQDPGGPHVGPMNFAIWVITGCTLKLSCWQLMVQPVMKISSKWRHFHFSVPRAVDSFTLVWQSYRTSGFFWPNGQLCKNIVMVCCYHGWCSWLKSWVLTSGCNSKTLVRIILWCPTTKILIKACFLTQPLEQEGECQTCCIALWSKVFTNHFYQMKGI